MKITLKVKYASTAYAKLCWTMLVVTLILATLNFIGVLAFLIVRFRYGSDPIFNALIVTLSKHVTQFALSLLYMLLCILLFFDVQRTRVEHASEVDER